MGLQVAMGLVVWVLGLCVGSFLNVVIYRLPIGLSISEPRWSFCPNCRTTLRWIDNLPLLSWLSLGARCRYCRTPISAQYPLVEAASGLAFVLVHHLLFVGATRAGLDEPLVGVDWPVLVAWLTLAASLLVCTAMDLVSYTIFPSVTNFACLAGIVLHALWLRSAIFVPVAATPLAAGAVAAFAVSLVMLLLEARRAAATELTGEEAEPEGGGGVQEPVNRFGSAAVGVFVFALLAIALLVSPLAGERGDWSEALIPAIFGALFLVIFVVGAMPRAADQEIHEAIEEEGPRARWVSLTEIGWLAPAIFAGLVGGFIAWKFPQAWLGVVSFSPFGGFQPVGGAVYSIFGLVVGAAAGWLVRIGFTLAFGREAFGTGDIFILAAAGACGGWDIALLGFLLAIPIALLAWILSMFQKSSFMIPFGPPLALGFVAALALSKPASIATGAYAEGLQIAWRERPDLILLGVGLLLVGGVAAVFAAKLLRHLLERDGGVDELEEKPRGGGLR